MMRLAKRLGVVLMVPVILGLCVSQVEAKKHKKPKIATHSMDNGTLDPFWFGKGLEFVETDEIDYLWVKQGFTLDGHALHFAEWPEPEFHGDNAAKRDENDHRLARMMAADMAHSFASSWGRELSGVVTTSLEDGDILVEGRIVDCSTGSNAAKVLVGFGAGSGNTTVDLKFTDAASGELLAAIHHRVVSGTTWSTTDSKFVKWVDKVGKKIKKRGLAGLYEDGDPTNK